MNPERSRASNDIDGPAVAGRIRAFCERKDERGKRVSMVQLSVLAGLSRSGVQKVCDRLERDLGDTGLESLVGIAKAMEVSLVWLLYGDHPPGKILLRSLPRWPDAAREAIERLGADPAVVEAVGEWHVHAAPEHLDGIAVAALTRVWRAGA